MGFFDTLLTAIAPERAVKRVAAQTAIRAINSGYSNYGASLHKKSMRGWMWHGGSPKEDIEDNLRVLRERSRDAYMGVPLATGAIKTMRTNVVCGGLTPTPQIDNAFLGISDEEAQKINEQIAREFALWANKPTCDADRIHRLSFSCRSHHGFPERYGLYFLARNHDVLRCGFREKYHCMGFPADRKGSDIVCAAVNGWFAVPLADCNRLQWHCQMYFRG